MRIKQELSKDDELSKFYNNANDNISLCCDVMRHLIKNPLPSNISVTATNKNPRKPGWFKVNMEYGGSRAIIINNIPIPDSCMHSRLHDYLKNKGFGWNNYTLWVKVEKIK